MMENKFDVGKITQFVFDNSHFEFDEISEDKSYLIFSSRKYGNQENGVPGDRDSSKATILKILLNGCFSNISVTIQEENEWVIIQISEKVQPITKTQVQLSLF